LFPSCRLSRISTKTFTIGFKEQNYNECEYAEKIAKHLKTEHTTFYLESKDALNYIPRIPEAYDEPFADSSQIPTQLVSALTRQKVKVALSGDGGDEVFGGYNRYLFSRKLSYAIKGLPRQVRILLSNGIKGISPEKWERFLEIIPKSKRPAYLGDKIHKLGEVLKSQNPSEAYWWLCSKWKDPRQPA